MILSPRFWLAPLLLLLVSAPLLADRAKEQDAGQSGKVSYYRDVRPIFQAQCHGCHQPAKQSGEYLMTEFARLVQGGESDDAAIVPGKPEKS